jgi:hypothetical protein
MLSIDSHLGILVIIGCQGRRGICLGNGIEVGGGRAGGGGFGRGWVREWMDGRDKRSGEEIRRRGRERNG